MKVKELIEKLEQCDPQNDIAISVRKGNSDFHAEITEMICQDRWVVWVHVDIIK